MRAMKQLEYAEDCLSHLGNAIRHRRHYQCFRINHKTFKGSEA